jgi:hypothetical protein
VEAPRRVPTDGVVDRLRDRDLDPATQKIILLDTFVVDGCSDLAVGQIEHFAGCLHHDVKGARHHAGVQLDIRCTCGFWFHVATGFTIIGRNARRQ